MYVIIFMEIWLSSTELYQGFDLLQVHFADFISGVVIILAILYHWKHRSDLLWTYCTLFHHRLFVSVEFAKIAGEKKSLLYLGQCAIIFFSVYT